MHNQYIKVLLLCHRSSFQKKNWCSGLGGALVSKTSSERRRAVERSVKVTRQPMQRGGWRLHSVSQWEHCGNHGGGCSVSLISTHPASCCHCSTPSDPPPPPSPHISNKPGRGGKFDEHCWEPQFGQVPSGYFP